MKYRFDGHGIFAAWRPSGALLGLGAALILSACTTASLDDAAPSTAAAPVAVTPLPPPSEAGDPPIAESAMLPVRDNAAASLPTGAARNTGAFPNLNVTPDAATEQFTPEQKAAALATLKARQQRQSAAAEKLKPADDIDRLRMLGETHGDDALKAIEEPE